MSDNSTGRPPAVPSQGAIQPLGAVPQGPMAQQTQLMQGYGGGRARRHGQNYGMGGPRRAEQNPKAMWNGGFGTGTQARPAPNPAAPATANPGMITDAARSAAAFTGGSTQPPPTAPSHLNAMYADQASLPAHLRDDYDWRAAINNTLTAQGLAPHYSAEQMAAPPPTGMETLQRLGIDPQQFLTTRL